MKLQQQIPRNALVWIIISLFSLVVPHLARLPLWVPLLFLLAAVWRTMVYRGRWSLPRWPIKLLMMLAGFAGIALSFRTLIGLEPTVALLLTAFALKLTELVARKDAYVLLFLGYFVILTEFLFSQDLLVVLFCLLNVILVTTALVALHRPGEHTFNRKPLRHASVMVMQSMPLMLVLFFLFPRIGPLWTVPIKSQTARTGMSDFMKPGDISRLSRSGAVAFRVQFEGDVPPQSELYWRGLVFSELENGAWSSLKYYDVPPDQRRAPELKKTGDALRYTVIMEPTQQNWLYSLRYAQSSSDGVMESSDFRLFRPVAVEDNYLYEARSWPNTVLDESLTEWRRQVELKLPADGDPQLRALASQIRSRSRTDTEVLTRVLNVFRTDGFSYTLQPPLLPQENPMDAFMFATKRGFCEHYAHAFVMMMRASGVPARVVAGYQGGEVNPVNGTVIVHQFDAHAWAEVWLQGQGWVRVDPTSAVAPDRIEWGLEQALAEEGSFLAGSPLSPLRYRNVRWLNQIRLRYDALTYQWQSWVVGFDNERQFRLLQNFFGEFTARKFAIVLLGSFALVLIPVALVLLYQRQTHPLSKRDKLYLRFCQTIAKKGVARLPGEPPANYSQRVSSVLPEFAAQAEKITGLYCELAYEGKHSQGQAESLALAKLARLVGKL